VFSVWCLVFSVLCLVFSVWCLQQQLSFCRVASVACAVGKPADVFSILRFIPNDIQRL